MAAACSIEGCERKVYSKGWCEPHYRRALRNGGEPTPDRQPRTTCSIEGCDKPHDARGLCHGHLQRQNRTGDPLADVPLRGTRGICSVVGCSQPVNGKDMCRSHRNRTRAKGDPRPEVPLQANPGDGWISHGYKGVPVPEELRWLTNGEAAALEHRLVMAQMLGRPLTSAESVHHRNGDRLDNRPENLELWSRYQPTGQRVKDKIEWAVQILAWYAPLVIIEGLRLAADPPRNREESTRATDDLEGLMWQPRPL
jgi:hypothetical protein